MHSGTPPSEISLGTYLEDTLRRSVVFFTGKGGVGKTTLAWSTALACASRGRNVVVAGWTTNPSMGPKNSLFSSLTAHVSAERLQWLPLNPTQSLREVALGILKLESIVDTLITNPVIRLFLLATPGVSDTLVGRQIANRLDSDRLENPLILVDLPSSGHAIKFFSSTLGAHQVLGRSPMKKQTERVLQLFQDEQTRLDLVALPESLPIQETRELKQNLARLSAFNFGYLVVNQLLPKVETMRENWSEDLPASLTTSVRRYLTELTQQKREVAASEDIGLPMVSVQRQANESLHAVILDLARKMGVAC